MFSKSNETKFWSNSLHLQPEVTKAGPHENEFW